MQKLIFIFLFFAWFFVFPGDSFAVVSSEYSRKNSVIANTAEFQRFVSSARGKTLTNVVNEVLKSDNFLRAHPLSTMSREVSHFREKLVFEVGRIQSQIEHRNALIISLDVSRRYNFSLQDYALSCEISALSMVLESLGGKPIPEDTLLSQLQIFPGPRGRDGVWGNPDKEFVGNITGKQADMTGFGVYETPLARIAEKQGYRTIIMNDGISRGSMTPEQHMQSLLTLLAKDNVHVILWGDYCTLASEEDGIVPKVDEYLIRVLPLSATNHCKAPVNNRRISWKTLSGESINTIVGEHAFLLLGHVGTLESPTHFIVWDTATGKHVYSAQEWFRKWELMEHRSLVVMGGD